MPGMATSTTPTSTQPAAATIAMGMSAMSMTFFHSASTPLFWDWWKPSGPQQYAATCVFLIALAAVTRILFVIRPLLQARRGSSGTRHQRLPLHQDEQTMDRRNATTEELLPSDEKAGGLNETYPETVTPKAAIGIASRWWSSATLGERLLGASCEAVLVCLGYFLYVLHPRPRESCSFLLYLLATRHRRLPPIPDVKTAH